MSLIDHRLLYVTGKGGVGKTTVALALGLASAEAGRRTVICEVGAQTRIPALYGRSPLPKGEEQDLGDGLFAVTVDPRASMGEWFGTLLPGPLVRVLVESGTFGTFVEAAPGGRELATIIKVWELAQHKRWRSGRQGFDTVVLDAPAMGHAVGLLRTPKTFADIARVGPLGKQSARVRDFVGDPACTALVAVATAAEMPVSETLDLETRLDEQLDRRLAAIVVNGMLPKRFSKAEAEKAATVASGAPSRAVSAAATRAREQASQLARLRRKAHAPVTTLPFVFTPDLDLDAIHGLSERLSRAA